MICNIHKFRDKLRAGHVCLGPQMSFIDPAAVEAMAGSADFLWIDLEHTPISLETLQSHLIAARAGGAPALVRVPSSEIAWVKRALDIGAEGVILPQGKSVQEIADWVSACRYPPVGTRGYGPRRSSNYGREADYLNHANDNIFVVVQIETREAVDAIDDIVRIPGIDSLIIGPVDLAGALRGVSGRFDLVSDEIAMITAKARTVGVFVGCGIGLDPEFAARVVGMGVQWLNCGGDCGFMLRGTDAAYHAIRERLK